MGPDQDDPTDRDEDWIDINDWQDEPTRPNHKPPVPPARPEYPRLGRRPGDKKLACYLCARAGFETLLWRGECEQGMPCCSFCAVEHLGMFFDLNQVYGATGSAPATPTLEATPRGNVVVMNLV